MENSSLPFAISWEDTTVQMLGRIVEGITAIEYTVSKEKVNVYGRGGKPVARARSRKETNGTLSLLQSEIEALHRGLNENQNDLTDLGPFDIVITYVSQNAGDLPIVHILENCEITEYKQGFGEGDTHMIVDVSLMIGNAVRKG